MSEHQAQADTPDPTPVADPLDAANSTNSGTNDFEAYEAEKEALLNSLSDSDESGDEPDDDASWEQDAEEQISDEEAEESEEQEEEPEAKAKDRFRFKDPIDQQIAAVAKAMGVNLIEAAKIVEGRNSSNSADPTKHQDASQEREASESVATVTATIKELQAQKREKLASLEFETAAELDEQIDALRDQRDELKVTEAREQSRQEQAETEKFYADYAASEDKTIGLYPDAAVKNSPMAKEMARLEAEMLELGDPLYHSTDKPFILAKEAALKLGIPMRKPGATPVKKSVQHRPIQPAGGNARTTSADANQRFVQEIESLDTLDAYERAVGLA